MYTAVLEKIWTAIHENTSACAWKLFSVDYHAWKITFIETTFFHILMFDSDISWSSKLVSAWFYALLPYDWLIISMQVNANANYKQVASEQTSKRAQWSQTIFYTIMLIFFCVLFASKCTVTGYISGNYNWGKGHRLLKTQTLNVNRIGKNKQTIKQTGSWLTPQHFQADRRYELHRYYWLQLGGSFCSLLILKRLKFQKKINKKNQSWSRTAKVNVC